MTDSVLNEELTSAKALLKAAETGLDQATAQEKDAAKAATRAAFVAAAWEASRACRSVLKNWDVPRMLPVAILPLPITLLALIAITELTGLFSVAATGAALLFAASSIVVAFLSIFPEDGVVAREEVRALAAQQKVAETLAMCRQQSRLAREAAAVATVRLAVIRQAIAEAEWARGEKERQLREAEEARRNSLEAKCHALLKRPWRQLRAGDFEAYLAQVFATVGYEVQEVGQSGDQGVDLIVTKDGRRVAVQAKGYSGSVGNSAIQQVYAGMAHYGCDSCAVITNSYFTSSAMSLAESTRCLLIYEGNFHEFVRGRIDVTTGVQQERLWE